MDENELVEILIARVGTIPEHMIQKAKKKHMFFRASQENKVIRSSKSRVPSGIKPGSEGIRKMFANNNDEDLIDFLEVSTPILFLTSDSSCRNA